MTEQAWSWEKALTEGALTEMQQETLQALVDNGEAEGPGRRGAAARLRGDPPRRRRAGEAGVLSK
jgi:hypothetical protein